MIYHIYTNNGESKIWVNGVEYTGTIEQCKNRAVIEEFKRKRQYTTDNQAWKNMGVMADSDLIEISAKIMYVLHTGEVRNLDSERLTNKWIRNK